jgi:hypothetical protein
VQVAASRPPPSAKNPAGILMIAILMSTACCVPAQAQLTQVLDVLVLCKAPAITTYPRVRDRLHPALIPCWACSAVDTRALDQLAARIKSNRLAAIKIRDSHYSRGTSRLDTIQPIGNWEETQMGFWHKALE